MVPQLLEVNYGPDNERICKYYPDFYNDAFAVLFLDEDKNHSVVRLVWSVQLHTPTSSTQCNDQCAAHFVGMSWAYSQFELACSPSIAKNYRFLHMPRALNLTKDAYSYTHSCEQLAIARYAIFSVDVTACAKLYHMHSCEQCNAE